MRYQKPVYIFFLLSFSYVYGQTQSMNYNDYYRFPLSLGVEYQNFQPLNTFDSDYGIIDIAADLRYPLRGIPFIQPFVKAGLINLDSSDQTYPDKWDHYHIYSLLGMGYSNRFVKNFELGGDIQGGISQAVFPNAVDSGAVGAMYMLLGATAKISLDPSYAFSIDIRPSIRYQKALNNFDKYDGFLIGFGFGFNFRFGEDPDSASAVFRNLRFDNITVDPVFSAMQSYYVKNPIGQVTLTNTSRNTLTDLGISFFQAGFMDSETQSVKLNELGPGKQITVDLLASYNQQVFTTNGITPLTGEVIVNYSLKGRPAEQRESVSYDLHDKTAITWDDDRKVGAFITPADSALQNYVSFIRKAAKDSTLPHYNDPLQLAMQVYIALQQIGMIYQIDPVSPFDRVQGDNFVVDSVKLSRDTLIRGTGDCDDLTVLFCSILESAGIETGFITVPGHIYPVINTGLDSRQYNELTNDRNQIIDVDGELWVPVEITMVGTNSFQEAWRRGADLWRNFEPDTTQRGFFKTRESHLIYRPVGLRESDLGLQYGNPESLNSNFKATLDNLARNVTYPYVEAARSSGDKVDYNKAGIAYARFGKYDEADYYFNQALRRDPEYLSAQVNLGNTAYLNRSFSQAIKSFQKAYDFLIKIGKNETSSAAKLLINMSKASYALAKYTDAQTFFQKASGLNPELGQKYAYLGNSDGTTRAADLSSAEDVIFLEE